jgi:hypothetical protein
MKSSALYAAVVAIASLACISAQGASTGAIETGKVAPSSVVEQIRASKPVTIGSVSVRPIPAQANGTRSTEPSGTTLVARASDNLVGTSTNDLVVIYKDTSAVSARVAAMGGGLRIKTYPDMGMVIVHAPRFDQLQPIQQQLQQALPDAKFDLPVRYFDLKVR